MDRGFKKTRFRERKHSRTRRYRASVQDIPRQDKRNTNGLEITRITGVRLLWVVN